MPLVWPALGLALGLFAGAALALPPLAVVLLMAAVAGGWLLAQSERLPVAGAALFAGGFLLGMLRAGPGLLPDPSALSVHYGRDVVVTGTVQGLPESVGARVRFELRPESVNDAPLDGAVGVLVWASVLPAMESRSFPYLEHGDRVVVVGDLGPPERFAGFDYPEHLAARGIGSVLSDARVVEAVPGDGGLFGAVHRLRRSLARALAASVPEPQAALAQALLLGMRGGMSPAVADDFRRSGLAHLLAVSGMHVGLVLGLSLAASAALIGRHRWPYLVPPLAVLWTYVLLAGAPSSAVRAASMGTVYLLALATGRAGVPLNAMGLAALVLLLWDPRVLWDRGFQLSFAAMTGVLAIGVPLWVRVGPALPTWKATGARRFLVGTARSIVSGVLVSIGATLASLPLVAFNFQQVPLLGIPATLIALPVLPPLLVAAFLTSLVGAALQLLAPGAFPILAPFLGWLPALLGGFVTGVAGLAASLPWGVLVAESVDATDVWLAYALGLLGFAVIYARRWLPGAARVLAALWRGPARAVSTALLVASLAVAAATPWILAAGRPDGYLHVHFLDVGQGDATLVRTPGGAAVLIDGGPEPRETLLRLDDVLPAVRGVVDLAILTHPHADHLNGLLELARRGRVARVLVPPPLPGSIPWWVEEFERAGVPVREVVAGATVELEDGVRIDVLHPPSEPLLGTRSDIDNNGLVLRLTYGEASVLFTGDLYADGEAALVASGVSLDSRVLKVGHHGSATSTSWVLLDAVRPSIAVVSAGADDRLGHPAPDVIERLRSYVREDLLFQTALHGTVSLSTDGRHWWVATRR